MAGKCSQASCFPDETGCNIEGCDNVNDCKFYSNGQSSQADENTAPPPLEYVHRIPWTGNAFGLIDLEYLTASSKPILIGIAGVASAGKTTFLAALYCLLRHGKKIGEYSFSGSKTLSGWEDIAWYLSWKENGSIQFPPHTTANAGRIPGILHLELKNPKNKRIDLIFTDAPGEWFDYWRTNVNAENAKGARWIHENSNAFLLFADCEMLNGKNRGQAKLQIAGVADRLVPQIGSKPFGLIWSKSDKEVPAATSQQVINHFSQYGLKKF